MGSPPGIGDGDGDGDENIFTFGDRERRVLESVGMKRKAGQAKILGTVVSVGGAMLLSFYHGHSVIGESSIHWKYADDMGKENSTNHHHSSSFILGPFLIIASTVSWAIWFIIQNYLYTVRIGSNPEPWDSIRNQSVNYGFLIIQSGTEPRIQKTNPNLSDWTGLDRITDFTDSLLSPSGIIGLYADRNISAWSLSPHGIRLFSSLYAWNCVYCSSILPNVMMYLKESSALLEEKLYVGTVVGSGLIVMGLYAVLWGKNGEMNVKSNAESLNPEEEEEKQEVTKSDLEIHFFGHSNGNFRTVRI
ncbi:unnamed protein product [Camellia sinensis]